MASDDRHLLVGLLALRVGLVDQGQLVAALQNETHAVDRPLADRLVALGHLTPDQRAVVEALAEVYLDKNGRDVARSLAALDAGFSTREGWLGPDDHDPAATVSHLGSGSGGDESGADTGGPEPGHSAGDARRFRVLRPHARGGLGEVSVALDEELNREVALKRILDSRADDPVSRARFLIEAEITGGLEHPGIVPVYGLGLDADGRPYYAMRLVKGDTLRLAVERFHADAELKADPGRRSLELRRLLRCFTDVCHAIEYAHSRGVIHRDIKPANIIVGRHGETLVIDWGLAKVTGQADPGSGTGEGALTPRSASASTGTLAGATIGTPAYMSPEQAAGDVDRMGPETDVYGLGATLYFILTGRPPFGGDDLTAVLRAVERGEYPPPRQIDPAIDSALSSIPVRAMALRPEDRYAGARALADDIERWMADEPVSAYRDGWVRSLARWAHHHRAAALSAVAALATLAVATSVAALVIDRARAGERRAKAEALANYDDARRQQRRAEANFDLARRAVDDYFTEVSEETLLDEPGFQPLRKKLLGSAYTFYEVLVRDRGGDPSVRAEWAWSGLRLAIITDWLGRSEEALAIQRACLAEFDALLRQSPDDPRLLSGLADGLVRSARLQTSVTRLAEAEPTLHRVLDITDSHPAAGLERHRAQALQELSWVEQMRGRHAEARRHLEEAVRVQEGLVERFRDDDRLREGLAALYIESARHVIGTRPEQAAKRLRRACEIEEELLRKSPRSLLHRSQLGRARYQLGHQKWIADRWSEAIPDLESARTHMEADVEANPSVIGHRYNLARVNKELGVSLMYTGQLDRAIPCLLRACELCLSARRDDPTSLDYLKEYADCCDYAGQAVARAGRLEEAIAWTRGAVNASREVIRRQPDDFWQAPGLSVSLANLGTRLIMIGRYDEAAAAYRDALDVVATPAGSAVSGHEPDFPGRCRLQLYRCLIELGWRHEAEAAMAVYRRGPAVSPDVLYDMAGEEARIRPTRDRAGASHRDHAMSWLRMAVDAGWKDAGRCAATRDLRRSGRGSTSSDCRWIWPCPTSRLRLPTVAGATARGHPHRERLRVSLASIVTIHQSGHPIDDSPGVLRSSVSSSEKWGNSSHLDGGVSRE